MKNIMVNIYFLWVIVMIVSCKKTAVQANTLVGKWEIINDSSSISQSLNGFNGGSNYIGSPGDFYNFTIDGNLYIKEKASADTGKYSTSGNNQIQITMFIENGIGFGSNGAIRGTYTITNLTANTVTLTSSGLTPEGEEAEIINLKK